MRSAVLLVIVCGVLAAPATASAPTLAGLQRQVTGLKQQVAALRTLFNSAATNAVTQAKTTSRNFDFAVCFHAQDLDEINAVWHVLNADLAYQGFTSQPDLPRYDDGGACQRAGMTRIR